MGCGDDSGSNGPDAPATATGAPKLSPEEEIRNSLAGFRGEIDGFDIRPDRTVVVNLAKGAPRAHAGNICAAVVTAHGPDTVSVYAADGEQLTVCP